MKGKHPEDFFIAHCVRSRARRRAHRVRRRPRRGERRRRRGRRLRGRRGGNAGGGRRTARGDGGRRRCRGGGARSLCRVCVRGRAAPRSVKLSQRSIKTHPHPNFSCAVSDPFPPRPAPHQTCPRGCCYPACERRPPPAVSARRGGERDARALSCEPPCAIGGSAPSRRGRRRRRPSTGGRPSRRSASTARKRESILSSSTTSLWSPRYAAASRARPTVHVHRSRCSGFAPRRWWSAWEGWCVVGERGAGSVRQREGSHLEHELVGRVVADAEDEAEAGRRRRRRHPARAAGRLRV